MATINWSLQHKRDTAANWTANNPTLLAGQIGIETDNLTTTPKFKIGDGSTNWNTLPYFYGGASSAQNLNNVLTVGNTTSGQNITLTTGDSLIVGANNSIYYDAFIASPGMAIVNSLSFDHIILQDAGGIHIDTTKVILEQLTASRLLSLNASKEIVNETGTGFLKLNAGVISYDNSTYLTTAAAALAYQPLDADLTSWAGVTRASGFDTFVATPSSANLASLVTDETGSGALVFGTSPTFTTDITTPSIVLSGNISAASWTTNGVKYKGVASTLTNTTSSGTVTNTYTNVFGGNTIVSNSATTYTNYYGSFFRSEVAGSGSTFTNNYAAGFNAPIYVGGGLGSNASIMVDNAKGYGALWTDATQALILRISNGDIVQLGDINAKNKGIGFLTNGSTRVSIGAGGGMTFADANNITFNATTGTKIGTATTEKLSFWNATPIVQPTTAVAAATFVANAGTAVNDASTFDGYTLKQVVKALRNIGLLA